MHEVLTHADGARAVLFDVDGTLYRQRPVRTAMMRRMAGAHWRDPVAGARLVRIVAAYRRAQEELRTSGFEGDVSTAQVERAAQRTGVAADVVRAAVEQWMEVRPLDVVGRSIRPGVLDVLEVLAAKGAKLAAVSDYPADRKLEALGIRERFDVVVTAQDPRVQAFKPNPRGLHVALEVLGVAPSDALFVGDRDDVDGPAAAAARVRFVLVGGGRRAGRGDHRAGRRPAVAERVGTA